MQTKNKKVLFSIFLLLLVITVSACSKTENTNPSNTQSNKEAIKKIVDKSRQKRSAEAQKKGYPTLWTNDHLPEYPSGKLLKIRAELGQITLETKDDLEKVKKYYDDEMSKLNFSNHNMVNNDFIFMSSYTNGQKKLRLQATKQKDTGLTKIELKYSK